MRFRRSKPHTEKVRKHFIWENANFGRQKKSRALFVILTDDFFLRFVHERNQLLLRVNAKFCVNVADVGFGRVD